MDGMPLPCEGGAGQLREFAIQHCDQLAARPTRRSRLMWRASEDVMLLAALNRSLHSPLGFYSALLTCGRDRVLWGDGLPLVVM